MIIKDHLNLAGTNPLMGSNLEQFGPRFPDMSDAYNKELRNKVKGIAQKLNISSSRRGICLVYWSNL